MSPAQLLEHFDRISEAPDAVARLRRFILDLAVRGKLFEATNQEWMRKPIEECLEQFEDGKKIHQGWSPQCETNPSPSEEVWGVLKTTAIQDGYFLEQHNKQLPSRLEPKSRIEVQPGDILITCAGPRARCGVVCLVKDTRSRLMISGKMYRIRADTRILLPSYLEIFLRSNATQVAINKIKTGSSESGLNLTQDRFRRLEVRYGSLAEQHLIVAKVDELMALCDQLEAAKKEREARRDRLVVASLHRIGTAPSAANGVATEAQSATPLRDAARFHLDHLPRLTTRPEHIKQLRQTILNLAVRGRLVLQDPYDEPAAELLKRIQAEKAQVVKGGGRKKVVGLPDVDLEQAPFELPLGWSWARFPELGDFGRGKSKHRPRNDAMLFDGGTHLLIQTGDVARSHGVIRTYTNKYNDTGLAQSMKWPAGTLCITIAANIADSGILSFDACFPDSVVGFIPASVFKNARYFEYFVRTAQANLLEFAPATAQKNINLEILNAVLIPIPPLAEQHRIVAKVDELMALCDQLEAQLTATQTHSRRLLEAVLHEALAAAA